MSGTLSRLLEEIATTLEPLVAASEDEYARARLLGCLGVPDPTVISEGLLTALGTIVEAAIFVRELAEKSEPTLADLDAALNRVRDLEAAFRAIGASEASDYPDLASDLINLIVLERLRCQSPLAFQIAYALGLVEQREVEAIVRGNKVVRMQSTIDRINLAGLEALISDPVAVLGRGLPADPLATTADANRTADVLAARYRGLLTALGLPTVYGWDPGDEVHLGQHAPDLDHTLAVLIPGAFGLESEGMLCISLSAKDESDLGIVVTPIGQVVFATSVGSWSIETTLSAEIDSLAFGGGAGFRALPHMGPGQLQASVSARRPPLEEGPAIVFGEAEGTRLEMGSPAMSANVTLASNSTDVEIMFETGISALVVKPGSSDGFLASLLPAEGMRADFDLGLMWSTDGGLSFKGAAGLELRIPISRSLGPVTLWDCHLAIGVADGALTGEASLTLSGRLGPVGAVIDRIGISARLFFAGEGGSLGVGDLNVGFKPPSGVGLLVEAPMVRGGGFVRFDPERHEYSGILELEIAETLGVKAMGLLTTRLPDGSAGYSLVLIIFVEGFTPIQLGFGFALTGIGGLVAINRTFDEAALRSGLKQHALDSVMFPVDPVRNAPQIISQLNQVFPPARGHHMVGPMLQIAWGTPALVTAEVGVVLEFGARLRLLLLAQVAAILPRKDHDVLRVQMDAVGVVDFDRGTAALDATLHDSRLLKKFVLTGDTAVRLQWKGSPNFALAAGGLHPAFVPPPQFPKLERIALNLASGDNPRIRCEAYFALTANTVQFGARAELYAGAGGFSIQGDTGFDVLIQLDPFAFLAEFHAQLQLKRGSTSLFKVKVEGALAGPRPLHLKARATFEIMWWDVTIRVDRTLVEGDPPPPPQPVDVLALLRAALEHPDNWTGRLPAGERPLVSLRPLAGTAVDIVLHPLGTLTVKQGVVPLDVEISKFGAAVPGDVRRFTVRSAGAADTPVTDFFAPAQFLEMSDSEKLSRPSFEPMTAGVSIGSGQFAFSADLTECAELEGLEFDTWIMDRPRTAPPRKGDVYTLHPALLGAQARFGAAGAGAGRHPARRSRAGAGKYRIVREGWSLVATDALTAQPVPGLEASRPVSYAEAEQALQAVRRDRPDIARQMTILRRSDVTPAD